MIRRDRHRKRSAGLLWPLRVCVVLILVWYLLYHTFGDSLHALGYVNAAGFWVGMATLVLAAVLCRNGFRGSGALSLLLGLAILATGGRYVSIAQVAPANGLPVRVVSASLRSLNTDMASAAEMLAGVAPDIAILQEVSHPAQLLKLLERRSRQRWFVVAGDTQMTLSRWPLGRVVRLHDLLQVDVTSPAGAFPVWNVRAPKSYTAPIENRRYFSGLVDGVAMAGDRGIAAGDFNATPWNDGYRDVHRLLDDVRDRSGFGPGFTFPSRSRRIGMLGPFLRIDHVLADRRFVPTNVQTVPASAGADHLPVVADFVFVPS